MPKPSTALVRMVLFMDAIAKRKKYDLSGMTSLLYGSWEGLCMSMPLLALHGKTQALIVIYVVAC